MRLRWTIKTWRRSWRAGVAALALLLSSLPALADAVPDASRQKEEDAWWTGPMLAASAQTLSQGHFLLEPYLFDVIQPHAQAVGSQSYLLYGIREGIAAGLIPNFGVGGLGAGLGDVTVTSQFRFVDDPVRRWPTVSLVVQETLPTGKYDHLGGHENEGLGSGAYTTTIALYMQSYWWLDNGRILRTRLDLSQSFSSTVPVSDASVYGTTAGFRGSIRPGSSFLADAAAEYSLTQRWVLAADVFFHESAATILHGQEPGPIALPVDQARTMGFAPAVEYSWTPALGVLLGVRIIPAGLNNTSSVTPAVAINYFY